MCHWKASPATAAFATIGFAAYVGAAAPVVLPVATAVVGAVGMVLAALWANPWTAAVSTVAGCVVLDIVAAMAVVVAAELPFKVDSCEHLRLFRGEPS